MYPCILMDSYSFNMQHQMFRSNIESKCNKNGKRNENSNPIHHFLLSRPLCKCERICVYTGGYRYTVCNKENEAAKGLRHLRLDLS